MNTWKILFYIINLEQFPNMFLQLQMRSYLDNECEYIKSTYLSIESASRFVLCQNFYADPYAWCIRIDWISNHIALRNELRLNNLDPDRKLFYFQELSRIRHDAGNADQIDRDNSKHRQTWLVFCSWIWRKYGRHNSSHCKSGEI